MIAIDTSSMIAFFDGAVGGDVETLADALSAGTAVLPPTVMVELLSDPLITEELEAHYRTIPMLSVSDGYWERVGTLRRAVLKRGQRARLGDALIAQTCLDHGVPLLSRDGDFRNYAAVSPLRLV